MIEIAQPFFDIGGIKQIRSNHEQVAARLTQVHDILTVDASVQLNQAGGFPRWISVFSSRVRSRVASMKVCPPRPG